MGEPDVIYFGILRTENPVSKPETSWRPLFSRGHSLFQFLFTLWNGWTITKVLKPILSTHFTTKNTIMQGCTNSSKI